MLAFAVQLHYVAIATKAMNIPWLLLALALLDGLAVVGFVVLSGPKGHS